MKLFKVKITETLEEVCEEKANSIEEAIEIVERKYNDEEIVLYPDNFVNVTFTEDRD